MPVSVAFQADAFQRNAFQVPDSASAIPRSSGRTRSITREPRLHIPMIAVSGFKSRYRRVPEMMTERRRRDWQQATFNSTTPAIVLTGANTLSEQAPITITPRPSASIRNAGLTAAQVAAMIDLSRQQIIPKY